VDSSNLKNNKVILFCGGLVGVGGAERLLFEEAKYFEKNGFEVHILTFDFREEVLFNKTYKVNIEQVGHRTGSNKLVLRGICLIRNILALRRKLRQINPSIILLSNAWDCISFYFAALFTGYSYSTHIHGTIFWFQDDLLKYAFIHRKVFNEIRESVIGHKEFISVKPPKASLPMRILKEFIAIAMYKGVRKSKKIFVPSNQMKWEVGKLYGKEAIALKGAFPKEILYYKPKQDIKHRLGLNDKKMILNVNRLDPRKRVDLLIKAFKQVSEHFEDVFLVIGGVGPDEGRLKHLAQQLNLADKINFIGYIREEELWDYLAACDVFAHPNWADFAIAAYEPLALQKKIVWSTEMEIDDHLATNKHIFAANPTVGDFAQAIEKALSTEVTERDDLSVYTWDNYCEAIMKELNQIFPPISS
jgi:glycosyltransferase involved in cell wall biosynthesis